MIQNTSHRLSFEQLTCLNRGPAYVSPCQVHISSTSLSIDQVLVKQMAPLRRQLTRLFTRYKVDISRRLNFEREIQEQFTISFSESIPSAIKERVFYEKQLIQSIQYQIKHDHLILRRTADENNTYYLGRLDEFTTMANDYILNSNSFESIGIIDESCSEQQQQQQQLTEIIKSIDLALEQLQQNRLIPKDLLTKLQIGKKANINLPHLYFLPEIHQDGEISIQPRLSSCENCPIQTLATYLEQLIGPLFESFSQSTKFTSGGDFIRKLQNYCIQEDCLLWKTHFATFKIHDLYAKISHSTLLTALNRFLINPLIRGRHQRLTSDAIEELTAVVLRNNVFSYNGKIYRYVNGSPLNLPLTGLLGDIYLQDWQLPLVRHIRLEDEFYGRYHDTGFFTWAGPIDKLQVIFNELRQLLALNLRMSTSINSNVNFLNAYIENQKGSLYTRVHHDSSMQSFLLPYAVDHPRLVHRQWFRFALIRAGQYCLSVQDFEEERLHIELTFLANGYSLDLVEYLIQSFFTRFNPTQHEINLNRGTYLSLRRQLFRCIDQQKHDLAQQQQLEINHQLIQLHYLFDWGSRCKFNQKFYKLWSTIINEDPIFKKHGLKIKLNSKHCYSSNDLLAQ